MPNGSRKCPKSLYPEECSSSLFHELGTGGDNAASPQVELSPELSPAVPRQDGPLSPNPRTMGWGQGTAPLADLVADVRARRAEQRAVRAEFAERRAYGLARRHAAKLAHWREHGLPPNLAELAAKIAARRPAGVDTGAIDNGADPGGADDAIAP